MKERYGFWNFAFDVFASVITGSLWLIWVIIRTIRNK